MTTARWTELPDKKMTAPRKISYTAVMAACAVILSYIEYLVSSGIAVPGIKLGLSNIPVVAALYMTGLPAAIAVGIIKSLVPLLIFGRLSGLLYSLSGITLAIFAMYALKKVRVFSLFGVNSAGSFFHIVGQLIAAQLMLGSADVWTALPLFGILSLVSGAVTYIPERIILNFYTTHEIKKKGDNND